MQILHRQVLKEVAAHSLLGLLLFTFVLFLRDSHRLMELLLRETAAIGNVLYIFALALPPILNFTIPMAVLVGVLITLSRMTADGEIIALRAVGAGVRVLIFPLALFALAASSLGLFQSAWVAPRASRARVKLEQDLGSKHVSAALQPRVFNETLPNRIFYVQDVASGVNTVWKGIFLADMSDPSGPKVTVAREGVVVSDPARGQLQLHLLDGNVHETVPETSEYSVVHFAETDIPISVPQPPPSAVKPNAQLDTRELYRVPRTSPQWLEARIEFHRRLAIPMAALVLALAAIPLGVSSDKGGKSTGIVLALLLVLIYYSLFIAGVSLARQGRLPVWAGVWTANIVFALWGLLMSGRVDHVNHVTTLVLWISVSLERMRSFLGAARKMEKSSPAAVSAKRHSKFPAIIDRYVIKTFLFYLMLTLAALIVLTEVVTFFVDLLNDVLRNNVPLTMVLQYFFHLTPQLIYITTPLCVLLAILISFSLLTQSNEVTAMKASGISLYRLSLPVFILSALLSVGLFFFDHYYVPGSNQIQDSIRNRIKGRPAQTYYRPDRKWMFGKGSWIYYYRVFEPQQQTLGGVTVFELDPESFRVVRRISAARAHWEPSLSGWVFEDGWVRNLTNATVNSFDRFQVRLFPELREEPSYFLKEVKQSSQMNILQLSSYLQDLRQSGFDVVPLTVQFHKKMSFPMFAFIMALLGMPFAFSVGRKGALTGIAMGLGIAMAYWGVSSLFEALGNLNEMSAIAAAWSPNIIFGLGGIYLFLRIET